MSSTVDRQYVETGFGYLNSRNLDAFFALYSDDLRNPSLATMGLPTNKDGFRAFLGFQGAQFGEASALAIVSLVPSIALGILVQRHLVRGLTLGAVRG